MDGTNFKQPRVKRKRKRLNPLGNKGRFWKFVNRVLDKFFLRIGAPQRCELCEGTSNCGMLTPAHTRRRTRIKIGDWWFAFRVAALGEVCHLNTDKNSRKAEPIIETLIADRFRRMGLTDVDVKNLLLACAEEVKQENPDWEYEVQF